MKNDPTMLGECVRGYRGADCSAPYFSSAAWLAFVAGQQLAKFGVSSPFMCAMSRGFSVKIETYGGSRWIVKFIGNKLTPARPELIGLVGEEIPSCLTSHSIHIQKPN